jgi:signal peptidase I
VNNEALFALARELFSMGKQIKFVVAGNSMYPFIRHNRDMVTLAGASFDEIKVSDIVLTYDATIKKYILHRVIKKTRDTYYMVGDAHTGREGPYTAENLIGVVTEIHRIGSNGSEKNISGSFYKLLARLWMLAKPCRPVIFRLYKFARGR